MQTHKRFAADELVEQIHLTADSEISDWFSANIELTAMSGSFDQMSEEILNVSWHNCELSQSRLTASVFKNCQFRQVVFNNCDLSAVTFIDCQFKDCVLLDSKCTAYLSFIACSFAGLTLQGLTAEILEAQDCRIYHLSISNCNIDQLRFAGIEKLPSRSSSKVMIVKTELAGIGGITQMANKGEQIEIDAQLWTLFGDLLLRQIGIHQIDS